MKTDKIRAAKETARYMIVAKFEHNGTTGEWVFRLASVSAPKCNLDNIQWINPEEAAPSEYTPLDIETAARWTRFLMLNTSAHELRFCLIQPQEATA